MLSNNTLDSLWCQYQQEINTEIERSYRKNKCAMDYLGIDKEEYMAIVNLIVSENLCRFNAEKGTIGAFVSKVISNKVFSYIKNQNRNKRKANVRAISLNRSVDDSDNMILQDTLEDKSGTAEQDFMENSDAPVPLNYLNKLSEQQKNILILRLCEYSDAKIMKALNITRTSFHQLLSGLRMVEKTQLIRGN